MEPSEQQVPLDALYITRPKARKRDGPRNLEQEPYSAGAVYVSRPKPRKGGHPLEKPDLNQVFVERPLVHKEKRRL